MENMEIRFKYHPPRDEKTKQTHELVRAEFLALANKLDDLLPEGREKSLVLTKLEEAMMWANASIARQNSNV
jgi:hypothetical protein